MWPNHDDNLSNLSQEELQARIDILNDIIGISEGKTWGEMHPDLTLEEQCKRAERASQYLVYP